MVTFISWGATTVFIAAVFPGLARNTPHARQLRIKYEEGEVENEIYEKEESLEKNRISNISMVSASQNNCLYVYNLTILTRHMQTWAILLYFVLIFLSSFL